MQYQIAGKPVGHIGYGFIGLTNPAGLGGMPSTEEAITTLKAALNAGANFWDAGEIYGTVDYNSLHLLNAYFTKYPEDASKVVLSIKSCFDLRAGKAHNDAASVKAHIENCLKVLDGKCQIDLFQPARLDPDVPVEETMGAIAEYVKAGKIGSVGLSECSAASVRKAVQVCPITAVEVELSLFETGILSNGVADACKEFGIPIIAYSPLNRGFLNGQLRKYEDMELTDFRRRFPRYYPENFDNNLKLVDAVERVAKQEGCTTIQAAIAWVSAQGERLGVPIIPIPGARAVARVEENMNDVKLSKSGLEEINEILAKTEVKGGRVPAGFERFIEV